jgi:hypothetical protein
MGGGPSKNRKPPPNQVGRAEIDEMKHEQSSEEGRLGRKGVILKGREEVTKTKREGGKGRGRGRKERRKVKEKEGCHGRHVRPNDAASYCDEVSDGNGICLVNSINILLPQSPLLLPPPTLPPHKSRCTPARNLQKEVQPSPHQS